MPSPLLTAGAQLDKPSKRAPIHISRFFSGLWTNRSPLREAATEYLIEKFYSGARYDSIWTGQNVEITSRLTPARRPGCSVYNSQTFGAINTFYPFRVTNQTTGVETIRVMADTPTGVYDATGPSTKTLLFTKGTGAGQTSFQGVGNTLYMGDGVETKKWIYLQPWQASTTYATGQAIVDSNGNIQVPTSISIGAGFSNQKVYVSGSNQATVSWQGLFTDAQLSQLPGSLATFSGFSGASFLNAQSINIGSAQNIYTSPARAGITLALTHAAYGPTSDSGTVTVISGSAVSGMTVPTWNPVVGGTTPDSSITWTNKGPQVQDWQPKPPISAPNVANTINATQTAWVASTFYWPSLIIQDSNNNLQLLTTAGTTGNNVPTWSSTPGATTADNGGGGTAVWTCQGQAAWQANHTYAAGAYVGVTFSLQVLVSTYYDREAGQVVAIYNTVTYSDFFLTTNGGISGSTTPKWSSGAGTSVQDGGITWLNQGAKTTRTASATSSSNISNSVLVSLLTQVVDTKGFAQNVTIGGISGGSAPTWNETNGGSTPDNQITWTNGGTLAAANTGSWTYGYAFKNSVTGDVSTSSPPSQPIVLNLNSYVTVSGQGDPNYLTDGVDTIEIYRTVQGTSLPLFFLADIPAPASGATWTYQDTSPDPPNPASTLNNLISADVVGTNAPPPSNLIGLTYHLSRLWGISGTFVRYSQVSGQEIGVGIDSWSANNYWQMPYTPKVLWPSAAGIFIFTTNSIWVSSGLDGNGNPVKPSLYLDQTGILSPNVFAVNGSVPAIFASDTTAQVLDPSSGVQWIGIPIANLLNAFSPSSSYVTWHSFGIDHAYYISDGSTGWYRLTPLSPPESGYAWSTKANIVGGCKCVQSVETAPGTRNLLIGPVTSGPILKRDLTLNTDNGSSYLANLVIGSIVLAQPNQCAEVVSITTECPAIGSHPTVGIVGNEIFGVGTITFESMSQTVNDPPFLEESLSLYADRWYFDQLMQPAWMRHLMINVSWPAENYANELYTYSLFGSLHTEG